MISFEMAEQKSCSKKNATPVSTSSRLQINPNGIKELSERLVDLVSGNEINRELIQLVHYLKSKSLRHERNAHAFRISGGLAALMRLLPLCTKHAKNLTLLLGTLGNLCALEQETRSMVRDTMHLQTGHKRLMCHPMQVMNTVLSDIG